MIPQTLTASPKAGAQQAKAGGPHPLVDTTSPNLLEDTFDYSLPPLIKFFSISGCTSS